MLSQGHLGKAVTLEKLVGVVVDLADGVTVWNGPGVECPIVAGEGSTLVFLGDYV
jgi:hypothetical protein